MACEYSCSLVGRGSQPAGRGRRKANYVSFLSQEVDEDALLPARPSIVLVPRIKFQDKARVNKHVLSTVFGLERAKALGAEFVFKVRADLLISHMDVLLKRLIQAGLPAFLAIWRFNHDHRDCVRDVPVDYFQFGPLGLMQRSSCTLSCGEPHAPSHGSVCHPSPSPAPPVVPVAPRYLRWWSAPTKKGTLAVVRELSK